MSVFLNRIKAVASISMITGGLAISSGAAYALPTFTFAPSTLGAGAADTANVVADNILLSDFSTIQFTPNGANTSSFIEIGTLAVTGFQLGSSPLIGTGLNTTYGMYFSFRATGNQTNFGPGLSSGAFTSLEFTLNGYIIPPSSTSVAYTPDTRTPVGVQQVQILAQGRVMSGSVTVVNGVPSANAEVSFDTVLLPFFLAPTPFYNMALSAFTNTSSQVLTAPDGTITITQGGGAANFAAVPVPEPMSLMMFGTGLVVIRLIRSKNKT